MGILINQAEGQSEAKTVLVMKQQPIMFAGTGDIGHFCGLDNTHVLPVFRHDYSRGLVLS